MSPTMFAPAKITPSLMRKSPAKPVWDMPLKVFALILTAIVLGASFRSNSFWTMPLSWSRSGLDKPFFLIATIWGVVWNITLAWRFYLWTRYKPMASVSDAELPTVSVIIPAFNEGALVRESVLSVMSSNYPIDKMQVIVVDDGSTDDTWDHISAAIERAPSELDIHAFRQPQNRGKRHALYAGFRRATGDVIVTIDSDSVVSPDALRNGVSPLIIEPEIGAVAGCVEVRNPDESIFSRFLKTTFSLSFKFVRAYQSEFRGVFCTPGAMSVYRAEVVHKVAEDWLNQKFLGMTCTTGEDRYMTNLILREGWLTAYQGNAVVSTEVPADYTGMCKMLLRWARSNIRETIVLQRFLFTNFRSTHLAAFRINMTLVLCTLILPYLLISNSWAMIFTNGAYALRHSGFVALYALPMCYIYWRNERDSDWIMLLLYEFFWVFCLAWIMPYALFTLRNTGWLTRGAAIRPGARGVPATVTASMRPSLARMSAEEPVPNAA